MNTDKLKEILDLYFTDYKIEDSYVAAQGGENTTAIVHLQTGPIVVRILGATHSTIGKRNDSDILSELSFMQYCQTNSIPVPKIFTSITGRLFETLPSGYKCQVMEYVEGETPENFTHPMLRAVASTMAKMHNIVQGYNFSHGRSWSGSVLETTQDHIQKYQQGGQAPNESDREVLDEAIQKFKTMLPTVDSEKLPRGVIHGDIMWQNIKFNNGKLSGIFDFDDCRDSYFLEDIAKSIMFDFEMPEHSMFGEHGQKADTFLQAYRQVRQLSLTEEIALPLFLLARFIYQVTRGIERPDRKTPGLISQAITQYEKTKSYFEL